MTTTSTMRNRLKHNRPSVRKNARPPKQRTQLGQAFTAANLPCALALQHCPHCDSVQYPPRELCQHCLGDGLVWRETDTAGRIINRIELHHSLWEYFKRRLQTQAWPITSVRLLSGATVFAHLAIQTFGGAEISEIKAGTRVAVFSHTDASQSAVLFAVAAGTAIETAAQRRAIVAELGLLEPSVKPGGI
jgi:uncharacterized OB-fold protein